MRPKPRVTTGGKAIADTELKLGEVKEREDFEQSAQSSIELGEVLERKPMELEQQEVSIELKQVKTSVLVENNNEPVELCLSEVKTVEQTETPAIIEAVEAKASTIPKPLTDMQRLDKIISESTATLNRGVTSVELYETGIEKGADLENGWYHRVVRCVGEIDAMSPRMREAITIMLTTLEDKVRSNRLFNGSVFMHICHPVSVRQDAVIIDKSCETEPVAPSWSYEGDEYVVLEAWLPTGAPYEPNSIRNVLVCRTKDRNEAISAFMDHRQVMLNKYDTGAYDVGELCIVSPHLNGMSAEEFSRTRKNKCRTKGCEELAEPGRAWCKKHLEQRIGK